MIGVELLIFAAPVAWAALGEIVGQRSGVINIGIEGVMLVAAFFAMWAAGSSGSPWIGMGAGIGAGLLLTGVQCYFTLRLAADQVVVGTAVNLFALGLTSTLFRGQYGASGQLVSVPMLPKVGGLDPLVVALIVALPLVALLLGRTRWGLAVRSAGEYPQATEAAGYDVVMLRLQAAIFGGALAALGGAYLALGVTGSFAEGMTAGRGFVAIALVTFGQWIPWRVFAAALLVGFAESLQFTIQAKGWNVPYQLLLALPYLLALLVLIVVGRGANAPASLGLPFRRSS